MAIAAIEGLKDRWTANGVLRAAEDALAAIGFDDAYVDSTIASPGSAGRQKVIKDGTWGMIEVKTSHLRLLDCPIVQRLRSIHQLGFSYLTYPSAEHSRFAHSLGMFSVVSKFLDEVIRRPPAQLSIAAPYSEWRPSPSQVLLAEHAAILHDIGHMPFSHVTEQILQGHKHDFQCGPVAVDDFLIDPEELLEKDKLAELLSVAIILTDRFGRFYREYVSPACQVNDPLRIAALVLGLEPEPGLAGIANLISGSAIDADKIDYINRDARACGIAVGVDVSRLFMRSQFLEVKPSELKRLQSLAIEPAASEVIFVVNASGIDSIEEIGQARTMLYHRVYLHQTTRNAERLLGKALQACISLPPAENGTVLHDALKLWTYDDFGLLRRLAEMPEKAVSVLAARLRSRDLPKRASAFGRRFVQMSVPIASVFPSMGRKEARLLIKQVIGTGLEEFRSKVLLGAVQEKLEEEISVEAAHLATLLRGKGKDAPKDLKPSVVSVLPMPNIEENRSDCIILDNEQLTLTSASSVSDEQMEASDIMKSTGYVLTDPAWRNIVFLAARTVFYRRSLEEHDLTIEPYPGDSHVVRSASRLLLDEAAVSQRIRMTGDDLRNTFRDAQSVGYFDDLPRLAPVQVPKSDIAAAANTLAGFSGQGNWHVSPESVAAFLSQFPSGLRQEVTTLMKAFTVFDKVELATHIGTGVRAIELGGARGFISALSPDSGGSVRTTVEHELRSALEPHGWIFKKSIRDVFDAAAAGDHLVLCDDNVTSGSQAICQFMAWLGVPKDQWSEEQRREQGIEQTALVPRDVDLLKQMKVHIVVAAGTAEANENLKTALASLGLSKFEGLTFGRTFDSATRPLSPDLETFLASVGTNVLAWYRHQVTDVGKLTADQLSECQADALGYSGAKALMCTPLNVPVGTLTAFWCPGYYKGAPWMPLLIRRGYLNHLVIS